MHIKPTTNRYSTGMGTRRGGGCKSRRPPPPWKIKIVFTIWEAFLLLFLHGGGGGGGFSPCNGFLLLFSLCGGLFWSLRGGGHFWVCPTPTPPIKNSAGAHEYRDRMFTLIIRAALFYSPL